MVIKGIPQLVSLGWNPAWGPTPRTTKIHLGIVVYQRWRYETWGMDLKFLTFLKQARLVWKPKSFWHSITFFFVKKDSRIRDYYQQNLTFLHTLNTLLESTGETSSGGEKCSGKG